MSPPTSGPENRETPAPAPGTSYGETPAAAPGTSYGETHATVWGTGDGETRAVASGTGDGGRSAAVSGVAGVVAVVSVRDVSVAYRSGHGRDAVVVQALKGVSLDIMAGETVGLVGESGSGKTTLGRVLLGLVEPTGGEVRFDGRPVTGRGATRRLRGRLQVVLQNPDWSLNPALHVWRSVAEPLAVAGTTVRRDRRAAVDDMLTLVGLDTSLADRHPHQLSGGQRQRVAIARAMITRPELIVFDEAVTALDVSVQTQVLNLIHDLQAERGFAALFISHDIAAVRYLSHRVAVAYRGELVETGPVERFYDRPEHPYTRRLLSAMPTIGRERHSLP